MEESIYEDLGMITYKQALSILNEVGSQRQVLAQSVPIEDSVGRATTEDVHVPEDLPSFSNSAMDGFAVCSNETANASPMYPIALSVTHLIVAGEQNILDKLHLNHSPKSSIEIMTGAPMPLSTYDAVVRIEDVEVERNPHGQTLSIKVFQPVLAGSNVRPAGSDLAKGQLLIPKDTLIQQEHILPCASLGITHLPVKPKLRAVILSTGSELVAPSEPHLPFGKIRNSTGLYLKLALSRLGIEVEAFEVIHDDKSLYQKRLEAFVKQGVDLVISTGAVSMGKFDFIVDVLKEMNAKVYFHKAAIRPGKPILFAELGGTQKNQCAFFGLPGNPVSTAVGLRFFISPYLRARMNLKHEGIMEATLDSNVKKPQGFKCFFKGRAYFKNSKVRVEVLKKQASYQVGALLDANCWVLLPDEKSETMAGDLVEVVPLHDLTERMWL